MFDILLALVWAADVNKLYQQSQCRFGQLTTLLHACTCVDGFGTDKIWCQELLASYKWLTLDLHKPANTLELQTEPVWTGQTDNTWTCSYCRKIETDNIWCQELNLHLANYVFHEHSKLTTNFNFKQNQCMNNYSCTCILQLTYFDFNKKPSKIKLHSNRTKILTDNIGHQQLLVPWPEQVKFDFKQDQHRFDCQWYETDNNCPNNQQNLTN